MTHEQDLAEVLEDAVAPDDPEVADDEDLDGEPDDVEAQEEEIDPGPLEGTRP